MFTSENQPEGRGRKKGGMNKKTRDIQTVISHLVESLNDGKLDGMLETLFIDKPEAVLNFIAKIAPKDIKIDATANLTYEMVDKIEQDV